MTGDQWRQLAEDFLKISAVLGGLYAFLRFVSGRFEKTMGASFKAGVETHVKPLVTELSTALGNVSNTVREVQHEHALTTKEFARTLTEHRERQEQHDAQIDDHTKHIVRHGARLIRVETTLELPPLGDHDT